MTLPALAALSDVEALLGRATTTQEQTYITTLLASASALARSYMRQDITQTLGDVITLNGTWRTRLNLPQRPVTNVVSVSVRGSTLYPSAFAWDRYGHIDLVSASATWTDFDSQFGTPASQANGSYNMLVGQAATLAGPAGSTFPDAQAGPSWSGAATRITVTYDHGYATVPAEIANEVAGMVAGQLATPTGVSMEQIGGYKVSYARQSGAALSLTPTSMAVLDRYRVRATSSDVNLPR